MIERAAHELLAPKRLNGEWFNASVEEALLAIDEAASMVTSEYTSDNKPADAKGSLVVSTKPLGQADAFSKEMVSALRQILRRDDRLRDLALFCTHIDTCTRASDVLKLRIGDVRFGARIRDALTLRQKKTKGIVECRLYKEAKQALSDYIESRPDATDNDWLFPGYGDSHLSVGQYQRLVKDWVCFLRWEGIALPDGHLSTHSIRRSKTSYIYDQTHDVAACMHLLGHSSLAATERYLGVNVKKAHEVAGRFQF